MKKHIILILAVFQIFTMTACGGKYIVNDLPSEEMSYSQLPLALQKVFMDNLMPFEIDGLSHSGLSKNDYVNLDTVHKVEFYSEDGKAGLRSPVRIIIIDGIEFEIVWQGNQHKPPFVFDGTSIYYLQSRNVWDKERILAATYVKVDVSKYLK